MDHEADDFETRMANYTYQRPLHSVREYGIVLAGMTGSGKSSTGNTILERKAFRAGPYGKSVTSTATSVNGDRKITVVDAPGLHGKVKSAPFLKQEIARMTFLLREGVHCFVICMDASEVRVKKETQQFLDQMKASGHADFFDYCMLVYTKPESELCDISLNEYVQKQKKNADMKSFLENIGDRVLAVNNKAEDPREKKRNKDAIIAMVDKVIEDNRIKKKPIVFSNDNFKKANELREKVVSVVKRENCDPSLVNAVVEAVTWFSKQGTIAEREFVEKVITILCESDQYEMNGTHLVFINDDEVTTTPVVDFERHIKMIYTETQSDIRVFYKLVALQNYSEALLYTAGIAFAGAAGLFLGLGGIAAAIVAVPVAAVGLPVAAVYHIWNKFT